VGAAMTPPSISVHNRWMALLEKMKSRHDEVGPLITIGHRLRGR
jgi:hypothetical protein